MSEIEEQHAIVDVPISIGGAGKNRNTSVVRDSTKIILDRKIQVVDIGVAVEMERPALVAFINEFLQHIQAIEARVPWPKAPFQTHEASIVYIVTPAELLVGAG